VILVIAVGGQMNKYKTLVYIAGPFSGNHDKNTENAILVGKLATQLGYAPVVPHTTILSGAYGNDDIKEERDNGIEITLSILATVCNSENSELWIISSTSGELSKGTKLELELWKKLKDFNNCPSNIIIKPIEIWIK
jgi:hypothetical protein